MMGTVKAGERKWRVVGVYVNGDMEKKWDRIREWGEGGGEGIGVIVGGDFNARIGDKGGRVGREEEEEEKKGKSKDKKVNREGRKLLEATGEIEWAILNGNMKGDEEGEYTYTGGRGESVIDYVITGEEERGEIECMKVEDRVESDHHPIVLEMKGGGEEREGREEREKGKTERRLDGERDKGV